MVRHRRTVLFPESMQSHSKLLETMACQAFWDAREPVELHPDGLRICRAIDAPEHHLFFATSGSSAEPKWIGLSKNALVASAKAVNVHLRVTPDSVWGLALPLHHVGGFGVLVRARAIGCDLKVFDSKWDAVMFCGWLDRQHVSHASLVPTQVHDLVMAGCRAPDGLRAVVMGGGRLDVAAGRAARALGWPVLASYGLTEAGSQVATQSLCCLEDAYDPTPLPVLGHWRVRLDVVGCLEIAGPALFSGSIVGGEYHPRVGEWHATRDRVSVTPGGLVPEGRADAVVKVAGELVDPLAVESRLALAVGPHGDCLAVVAAADARLGNRLVLVAERRLPKEILDVAVADFNVGVPRSQRLDAPVWVDRLPRSALGKIQRGRLREWVEGGGG